MFFLDEIISFSSWVVDKLCNQQSKHITEKTDSVSVKLKHKYY